MCLVYSNYHSTRSANPPFQALPSNELRKPALVGQGILVIDDEPAIVNLMVEFFRREDVDVYGFTDARCALSWYETHFDSVALTFLDMKMPGVSGEQCFYEIKDICIDSQIALMSGFLERRVIADLIENGALRFFQKPFQYKILIDWTLQEVRRSFPKSLSSSRTG